MTPKDFPSEFRRFMRSDIRYRFLSLAARGLFSELWFLSFADEPAGYLTVNGNALSAEHFARIVECTAEEAARCLSEISQSGLVAEDKTGRLFIPAAVYCGVKAVLRRQKKIKPHDVLAPDGSLSWLKTKKSVLFRDGFRCTYCGSNEAPLHVDHIHPKSKGGTNDLRNLTTACAACNFSKRAKTLEDWLA